MTEHMALVLCDGDFPYGSQPESREELGLGLGTKFKAHLLCPSSSNQAPPLKAATAFKTVLQAGYQL